MSELVPASVMRERRRSRELDVWVMEGINQRNTHSSGLEIVTSSDFQQLRESGSREAEFHQETK